MSKNILKIIIFSLSLFCFQYLHAQIAVGLKESALGNSGVAFTDSSAPSYYNPALLSEKQKSNFSITGTTLTSFKSSSEAGEFTSTKFAPNYISSIQAFGTFIHEFSLVNQVSIDTRLTTAITSGSVTTNLRNDQYNLVYSFAFKDFPFGFQTGLRINDQNVHLNRATNDGNIATGTDLDISQRVGHLFLGFGGIHQLGANYRFGYKYETQGLRVYKKTEQSGSYYFYDKANNLFSAGPVQGSTNNASFNTQIITLGHSFTVNDHEFLTDTRFTEDALEKNSYIFFQTFGYKVNFSNKMKFMTGASHDFDTHANSVSAGFSWQTNAMQSTLTAYHAQDKEDSKATGLTFGSEFVY